MAVPKRKMSRSNTRARRSQWKATATTLTKRAGASRGAAATYARPHMAHVVTDSAGTPLYLEYKGRRVKDL